MARAATGIGALLLAAAMALPSAAAAQDDGAADRLRVGGFLNGGFGGEADVDFDALVSSSWDADLNPSVGLGTLVDYPVIPYLAVGGMFRLQFLHVDGVDDDASTAMDLSLLLRARYPFEKGEVYFGVPVGFSMLWVNDDINPDLDGGPGWNVGLLAGGQYLITDAIGIFGHLGGLFRGSNHDVPGTDVDITTKQFILEGGVSFLL
ncbi:MAG: hypothetical protein ACODAU_13140 [Myxococcota bacterium]